MPAGTPIALTTIRVERGAPAPTREALCAAIERDRLRLQLPAVDTMRDLAVAGPYPIVAGGKELDEYVVWER